MDFVGDILGALRAFVVSYCPAIFFTAPAGAARMGKPKQWLGLDIGGANLKAAMSEGFARQVAFSLWRKPNELPAGIAELIREAPPHRGLAVTMTGELADCYATKAEGVAAIVAAVEKAASGTETRFYSINSCGWFLDADSAKEDWPGVAASNWHALATACAWLPDRCDLLVDVGSTTSDIIPIADSYPSTKGMDDTSRLIAGELLYQGVARTPICAVVDELPYRGAMCPVAAELFATTADVALMLDYLAPNVESDTADGRPLTKPLAIARLARMVCADASQFDETDAMLVATHVCLRLEERLCASIERVVRGLDRWPKKITISGSGSWLARSALIRAGHLEGVRYLSDLIGEDASRCAPAWAVASLIDEWSRT
jgi:probable H4MPT-linked C1 transfer pathway protein